MKKYLICNNGCDDTTETEIELDEIEFKTILKFAKENNKNSTYGCMPKIAIYEEYEKEEDGYYKTAKWVDGNYIEYKDLTEEK